MSLVVVVAWIGAAVALLVGAARALEAARRDPAEAVARGGVVAWAAAIAAVAAAAVWVWSGALARDGAARLRTSQDASAHIELRALHVDATRELAIGFSPSADVELPASWTLDEAARGEDVLRVARDGDAVTVTATAPRSQVVFAPTCGGPPGTTQRGARVVATLCRGERAIAAMTFAPAAGSVIRIEPVVRRAGRLAPHATELAAAAALQLGAASGAVPGLASWELPAPRGHADVLVAPDDVGAGCAAWADHNDAVAAPRGHRGCGLVLPPVYELAIRLRAPDVAGVDARAGWAAGVIGGPPVLALLALAALRRGAIDRARVARVAAVGALAAVLVAIAVWRLAWAHRIDVLRDLEPVGARTLLAALLVVATGGVIAGVAASLLAVRARLAAALLGVVGWSVVGAVALVPDLDRVIDRRGAAGVALVAVTLAAAASRRRALTATPPGALAALAVAAVVVSALAPRLVAAKLLLAWAIPVVGYEALRAAVDPRALALALAALGTALLALFHLDAGVTVAIAAPALVVAAIVVTHDLLYHPRDARLLDRWERHQRPLTLGHAAVVGGAAVVALTAILIDVAGGLAAPALPAAATAAALHAPAAVALAMAAAAIVARRRGRPALVPAVVALVAALAWTQRDAAVARAIGSDDATGKRVAAVVAPGYALLRDEAPLVAAVTAWRETRVDGSALAGDGWFAASIADPGVALSIENDYVAVLIVRETGVTGAVATAALLLVAIAGAWSLGAASRRPGARGTRRRTVAALSLGVVTVYQPLAALGVLPLTGVSWPGLGLDSPSDALVHLALLGWLALPDVGRADAHELAIRTAPRWRQARAATAAAAALAVLAGVAIVGRGAAFAADRGDGGPLAAGVDRAAAYASSLACPVPVAPTVDAIPPEVIGVPTDASTARFHDELRARLRLGHRELVAAAARCTSIGAWRAESRDDGCALSLDAGWPAIEVTTSPAGARCAVHVDRAALAPLRRDPRPATPRIRVVGAVLGEARADRVELVSDHLVARLRPGDGAPVDLASTEAGLVAATAATLAPGVTVTATERGARIEAPPGAARLLLAEPVERWRRVPLAADVSGTAVLLVDAGARRRAWLVRAADGAAPAPLLADDVGDRRHYVYAGALPALGWVNPYDVHRSLGLDGWIHAAVAEQRGGVTGPVDPGDCGTLAPPRDPAPVPSTICAASRADGVLECRLAVAPRLELELRALTELAALEPTRLAAGASPATRAAFVLVRGDTGEILAASDFVPGRAGSVYAPGTPRVERALVALREEPGEASAERFDLHRPIAVGSTLKPFVARAAEQTAPRETSRLLVHLDPDAPRTCTRGRREVHDLLGHCPPRELVDHEAAAWVDFHEYLAGSSNAVQALLGLVAPGWPDGRFRAAGVELAPGDVLHYSTTGWTEPLEVEHADRRVIGPRSVRLEALRATPFWQRFEGLVGRPLCTLGTKRACARAADRRDVCAARGLRVTAPGADLRHLVALGPSSFDMFPAGDAAATTVPTSEYFQLLRGSAVHPIGSLAQLTDAFNRLVFEPAPAGPHRLAASWFPAPVVGAAPASACTRAGGRAGAVLGDDGGLCGVVRDGGTAARALGALLDDPRVAIYGAKTGTIDTLGDVAERRAACEAWNRSHTIPGAKAQPYHLACGRPVPDDSLLVVSFGVRVDGELVPLTLGVQLERSGKGVAAHVARAHVEAILAHLGAAP